LMRFGHQYYQINIIVYMDSEKELLKKDLANQEKPKDIENFVKDAELYGHEDIAELGRKKLQEILNEVNYIKETSESQDSQVESMGGNTGEVEERTKEVDQKIGDVKAETAGKIEAVQNQGEEKNIENNQKQTELNNLRKQLHYDSLDFDPDTLKSLCLEHQKIEKEAGEDTFFVKNTVSQYVLKNYEKFSKDKLRGLISEFLDNDPGYLKQVEEYGVVENVNSEVLKVDNAKDIEFLKSEKLELTSEDRAKELEDWNNGLEKKIEKLKQVIESSYNESGEAVRELNKPDISPESKKMWENSRDFWRAQAEGNNKRELIEAQRQLEKNKNDIKIFDTQKEQAKMNLENTEKEILSLEQDYEKVRTEHKNAVKNKQDDFVLGRIVVELHKKDILLSDAKMKYSKLKYDYEREFTKKIN